MLRLTAIVPQYQAIELLWVLLRLDKVGAVCRLVFDDGGYFSYFVLPATKGWFPVARGVAVRCALGLAAFAFLGRGGRIVFERSGTLSLALDCRRCCLLGG